jgi:mRNA interferase MazF
MLEFMNNDFDKWNELKKKINSGSGNKTFFPKVGEVWICSVGKNVGFEQNGCGESFSRPVIIIKKFNNQIFWIISLSSKQKQLDFYYNFCDPEGKRVSIILAQLKLVSIKRLKRKLYQINHNDLLAIKSKLIDFLII